MEQPGSKWGKRVLMPGKSPTTRGAKKVAQLSIKEKQAAKREKREPDVFLKPRKGASR
ncbi:hypothetical protein [Miniimonas arenae]|uniref:hypothetical protein n=1 Tax=Miniimonas arenae TaxID=676201 RepID=UPI0015D5E1D3|nr:hypothetical protein [Miniimonas arenae]